MEAEQEKKGEEIRIDIVTSKGFGWRIALSIIMGVSWLAFLIIWLFFFAGDYNIYQNIGIFILSILILCGILGVVWISAGMKYMSREDREKLGIKGFKIRMALSIIIGLAMMIFLVIWLFYYAADFNIYQNIAIFIVVVLIAGGIIGASWAPWGIKYGNNCK